MAGRAFGSEMTVMVIVVEMAGNAAGIQLVGEWIPGVAIAAGQVAMGAIQEEASVTLVIEA